jgi:hypothetical protein
MVPGQTAQSPFVWGRGGKPMTPEEIERQRELAQTLQARGSDTSPVGHWTQGAARLVDALGGVMRERRAASAESANMDREQGLLSSLLGGTSAGSGGGADIPASGGGGPDFSNVQPAQGFTFDGSIRDGIASTAESLGIDPIDLATAISYETAGTFDPTKRGPTTQWGQHRGLIQFGEPQARQHGVNWDDPIGSQLGPQGAVANYLRSSGVTPGMGLLDIYSAINAGAPGLYNRTDANNGGAPGTVRDKVEQQMAGHRAKALAMFADMADMPAPGAAEAGGQDPQQMAAALASLHPEGQPQTGYASMPPEVVDAVGGLDMRRQPGAQPVHPLDAAARMGEAEQMGMPADQNQQLAAALLGRQGTIQEAGIDPRETFLARQGGMDSFGLDGPEPFTRGAIPDQNAMMGLGPRGGGVAAMQANPLQAPEPPMPPMEPPVEVAPAPIAPMADMPADRAMPVQGQPAMPQQMIDPNQYGQDGSLIPPDIGNMMAAQSFIEQGRPVPERLQQMLQGSGGGAPMGAQAPQAPADPRQQVAQAMMGQGGGIAAGGAPMPAQADPRQQVAQAMSSRGDMAAQIMMDPRMSPQARQMAQMIFQQEQAQQQAEMERARQQQQLEAAGIDPNYAGIDPLVSAAAGARYRAPDSEIQRFEYGQENPEFFDRQVEQRRAGSTNVSVDARQQAAPPEPGFRRVFNEAGEAVEDVPIPGSRASRALEEEERQRARGSEVVMRGAQNVFEDSSRALDVLDQYGNIAAGPGSMLDRLPATPARALRSHIDSLKGNIGIDSLLKIKESGAGLGAIPQAQLEMLASLLGNLDTAQSPADLRFNLERIRETYEAIVEEEGGNPHEIYERRTRGEFGASGGEQPSSQPGVVDLPQSAVNDGITPEEWQVMTPEERALWQ